jgi:hypothetical protein
VEKLVHSFRSLLVTALVSAIAEDRCGLPRLSNQHVSVLGYGLQQVLRNVGDVIYGAVEGFLVALRGRTIATDLAHELKGGGANLLVVGDLIVVSEADDASAHGSKIEQLRSVRVGGHFRQLVVIAEQHQQVAFAQHLVAMWVDCHRPVANERYRRNAESPRKVELL